MNIIKKYILVLFSILVCWGMNPTGLVKAESYFDVPNKVMWGTSELKKGQIGRATILADTDLWKLTSNQELIFERKLRKSEFYRIYGFSSQHGGLYYLGGGYVVKKDSTKVKYETPAKMKMQQLEMANKYNQYMMFNVDPYESYQNQPKLDAPYYEGTLKESSLQQALNYVKFIRYLAGLSETIVLNPEWNRIAQHGAAVLAITGQFTHTPENTLKLPEDFFQLGYDGTSSSNIAMGYGSLIASIRGYMGDEDSTNIDRVGHRRWILNPYMQEVGFGKVSSYSAMKIFGDSKLTPPEMDFDYTAWPNKGLFPTEFVFSDIPHSVLINPSKYKEPDIDNVTVTLKNNKQQWKFFKGTNAGYFNVNTVGYGNNYAIIFRPDSIEEYKGEFEVEVTGLELEDGTPATIKYKTTFIDFLKN